MGMRVMKVIIYRKYLFKGKFFYRFHIKKMSFAVAVKIFMFKLYVSIFEVFNVLWDFYPIIIALLFYCIFHRQYRSIFENCFFCDSTEFVTNYLNFVKVAFSGSDKDNRKCPCGRDDRRW